MADIPEKITEIPVKLTGSFIRHFLKYRYRKTLLRLYKGENELPEGSALARVVIFHGYTKHANTTEMQQFRHALVHKGSCDVFHCDLPYHGLSVPKGKEQLRGKIRNFERLIEAVFALTLKAMARPYPHPVPSILIGYSAGGLALVRFLEENPALQKYIARVILIAPPFRVDQHANEMIRKYKPYIERVARWASYIPYVADIPVGDIPPGGDIGDELEFHKRIDLRSAMEMHVATIKAKRSLDKITLPITIIHGTNDATALFRDAKDAWEMIATPPEKKRFIPIEGAPHQLLDEHKSKGETIRHVLAEIDEVIAHPEDWVPVEYENIANFAFKISSVLFFAIEEILRESKKILLRWLSKLAFWRK